MHEFCRMTPTRTNSRNTPTTNELPTTVSRTTVLLWFVLVGFAWLVSIGVLAIGVWPRDDHAKQILVAGWSLIVGLLTFVPIEYFFRIRGVAVRGVIGLLLFVQVVLYVPAPTDSILWVPDIPVYVLVGMALYWLISSLFVPLTYLLGKVFFVRLSRRYDIQRAWRQSREIALYCVGLFGLFGLRAFILLLVVPWTLMILIAEVVFLSYVEPPVTR